MPVNLSFGLLAFVADRFAGKVVIVALRAHPVSVTEVGRSVLRPFALVAGFPACIIVVRTARANPVPRAHIPSQPGRHLHVGHGPGIASSSSTAASRSVGAAEGCRPRLGPLALVAEGSARIVVVSALAAAPVTWAEIGRSGHRHGACDLLIARGTERCRGHGSTVRRVAHWGDHLRHVVASSRRNRARLPHSAPVALVTLGVVVIAAAGAHPVPRSHALTRGWRLRAGAPVANRPAGEVVIVA